MRVGHSTFLAGKPLLLAGMLSVGRDKGDLVVMDIQSGHYQPHIPHVKQFVNWCRLQGMPVDAFEWKPLSDEELAIHNATRADWDAVFAENKENNFFHHDE